MKPTVLRLIGLIGLLSVFLFSFSVPTLSADSPLPSVSSESGATVPSESDDRPTGTTGSPADDPTSDSSTDTTTGSQTESAATESTTHRPGTSSSGTGGTGRPSTGVTISPTTPSGPSPAPTPTPAGRIVAGYYGGWAAYKGYTPQRIPADKLTHLHYAFAKIDPTQNRIALADPAQDRKNFAALRQLKQKNPQLKTLISIGGWDYSTYFSDIASTAARRDSFARSIVDFLLEHGFDGVDLDWEYPVSGGLSGNTNRPQDKQNFTLLLRAIRERLDEQGRRDGRRYYLTIAGAANSGYLSRIEPQRVAELVDYIFVMTYDMHGPWDSYADLNAPLYTPQENAPQYKASVSDGIRAYLQKGVSADKLVLGMPFYGYVYEGVSAQNNGLYSRFSSAKSVSYDTLRSAYLNNRVYTRLYHSTARVPYLYGNNTFISYEDADSIAAKVSLAKSMKLAGIGIWELSHDTSGTLLSAAWRALHGRQAHFG
mgnify:CR=1 FL=1